jgi:hypothetical protein
MAKRDYCPSMALFLLLTVLSSLQTLILSEGSVPMSKIFDIRGGLVPQASEAGGDYYEQFELDYGSADKRRVAGALRGFIRSGKLASLPEYDPFLKWLNEHLEKGPEPVSGRLKPFYVRRMNNRNNFNDH